MYTEMDNTESAWNFWFPGQTGIYYTVLDTKAKELSSQLYIKSMQLNGEEMTYDAPNYAWTKVITTTADNTPISIVATWCRVQQGYRYRRMLQP